MKILCTTSSFNAPFPENMEIIKNPYQRKLNEEEVLALIKEVNPDALIAGVEPLTRRVMENAPHLKVISRCGVGLDSVDLEAAKDLDIKVFNTPNAPVVPVAELTVAFILSALRNINMLDNQMRKGEWIRYQGALLNSKTVGVIGCGRIGTYVSKILKVFGSKVLGCDQAVSKHSICQLTDLDILLNVSDIITLHVPISKSNYHMIDAEAFDKMKNGVIIVNTARGGLIDENALIHALESGKVAFAALDVFEEEPYNGPLLNYHERTILTPHNASSAKEARIKMEEESVKNLLKGLNYI